MNEGMLTPETELSDEKKRELLHQHIEAWLRGTGRKHCELYWIILQVTDENDVEYNQRQSLEYKLRWWQYRLRRRIRLWFAAEAARRDTLIRLYGPSERLLNEAWRAQAKADGLNPDLIGRGGEDFARHVRNCSK